MDSAPDLRIVPISQTPWGDVAQVFGTRGDPAGCWCQYFKLPNKEWNSAGRKELESMLREQSSGSDPGPGLIAYADKEPVGWCAVEPRWRTPRILSSKIPQAGRQEPDDDPTVWAIACVVVRVGFRRLGIGAELVSAAVDLARDAGARVVEGYPVDTSVATKVSSAALYHGTVSMFAAEGFEIAARPTPQRVVMRLAL